MHLPCSIEEVVNVVKHARDRKKTIRVTGAAHSFSAVAMPEHIALSLHNMRGLISIDAENQEATLWGALIYMRLDHCLQSMGLA